RNNHRQMESSTDADVVPSVVTIVARSKSGGFFENWKKRIKRRSVIPTSRLGGCGCTCRCSCSPAWSRAPRVAVIRCCKIRPNSRCAGSDDYAGYMLARHIKPKKIFFHSRLPPHETCDMKRKQQSREDLQMSPGNPSTFRVRAQQRLIRNILVPVDFSDCSLA